MKTEPYIEEYPCKCSGGDMCYIIKNTGEKIDWSYKTREEAQKELDKLNGECS